MAEENNENEENEEEEEEEEEVEGIGITIFSNDWITVQAAIKLEAFFGGSVGLALGGAVEIFVGVDVEYFEKYKVETSMLESANLLIKSLTQFINFIRAKNIVGVGLYLVKKNGELSRKIGRHIHMRLRDVMEMEEEHTENVEEEENTFEKIKSEINDRIVELVKQQLLEYKKEENIFNGQLTKSLSAELRKIENIKNRVDNYFQEVDTQLNLISSLSEDIDESLQDIKAKLTMIEKQTDTLYNGLSTKIDLNVSKTTKKIDSTKSEKEIESGISLIKGDIDIKGSEE